MRLVLDTNRYSDLMRSDAALIDLINSAREVFLPFVVLAELRAGFLTGQQRRRNEALLEKFMTEPSVSVLYADDVTTRHYASLYAFIRKQGTPIPTNDLWIAALVEQHGLTLCSRDAHFDYFPQLARV